MAERGDWHMRLGRHATRTCTAGVPVPTGCGGLLYSTDGGKEQKKAKQPSKAHTNVIAFTTPATAFEVIYDGNYAQNQAALVMLSKVCVRCAFQPLVKGGRL